MVVIDNSANLASAMTSTFYYKDKAMLRLSTLLFTAWITWPNTVFAHAILVKSDPAKDAIITVAPTKIDIWFNDKVGSEYKALTIIDSKGNRVDNKDIQQERFDPSHIFATVQPLTPGTYTVRYRVVSIDTHIVTGKFQFSLKAP